MSRVLAQTIGVVVPTAIGGVAAMAAVVTVVIGVDGRGVAGSDNISQLDDSTSY